MDFFKIFNFKDTEKDKALDKFKKLKTLLTQYNIDLDENTLEIRPLIKREEKEFFDFPGKLEGLPTLDELFDKWKLKISKEEFDWKLIVEDMDRLFYESPIFSRAIHFVADEIIQTNLNDKIVEVLCNKREIQKEIELLFKRININEVLRQLSLDLVRYGNTCFVILLGEEGVESLQPIHPSQLTNILIFKPYELLSLNSNSQKEKDYSFRLLNNLLNIDSRLKLLKDMILNDSDVFNSYFKEYIFGYEISRSVVVPPWRFLHFRNYYPSSPFGEYGVPLYIHALSPYKQYSMAIGLQVQARQARLPIFKYKLRFPNVMSPSEKLERAVDFVRRLENTGLGSIRKEPIGIGERLVTIEELYDIEEETPNIDLGKIDDINLLHEDLYLACLIPRGFIDPNNQTFGNSGVALRQQFIPFARLILRFQLIILKELYKLIRIHLIFKGYTDEKDLNSFVLSMPFPESQFSQELLSSYESTTQFVFNLLDNLAQKIGIQGELPIDLVYYVLSQFLPVNEKFLDKLFKKLFDYKNSLVIRGSGGEEIGSSTNQPMDQGFGTEGGGFDFSNPFGGPSEQTPIEEPQFGNVGTETTKGEETQPTENPEFKESALYFNLLKYIGKNSLLLEKSSNLKSKYLTFLKESLLELLVEKEGQLLLKNRFYHYSFSEMEKLFLKIQKSYTKQILKEVKSNGKNK